MEEPQVVWNQLQQLMLNATNRITLVSPFIKYRIFADLIATVPETVQEISCITRWSVSEVAAGVSDPEIIELASRDPRITIDLCHSLHAKIFIAGELCQVGSANLTGKATGIVQPENIEILVELPASHHEVQRVLKRIQAHLVRATPDLAITMRQQANLLNQMDDATTSVPEGQTSWYPTTRAPERLYPVYSGSHGHNFSQGVLEGVVTDLARLDLEPGMSEDQFANAIRARLRDLVELSPLLKTGSLLATDLERELREHTGRSADEARRLAENIAEWLRYFDNFMISPAGSWEIRTGRVIR